MKTLDLDYWNEKKFKSEERFTIAKENVIRWYTILNHTYIEYLMIGYITRKFFKYKKKISIENMIKKNKNTKTFNQNILENLSFIKKKELLLELKKIPKDIIEKIEKINTLRNKLAHLFSFEIWKKQKWSSIIKYNNYDIMTINGISLFTKEVDDVIDYLERI